MSQAITRCPVCQTSFRVNEEQLRVADGAVRCGACLHVFQAEDYFISPMLDATERLAIQADYWTDFDTWVQESLAPSETVAEEVEEDEQVGEPEEATEAADPDAVAAAEEAYLEELAREYESWVEKSQEEVTTEPVLPELNAAVDVGQAEPLIEVPVNLDVSVDPEHLVQDQRRMIALGSLRWLPAILVMLLAGGLQYAWFNMDTYAQQAEYRPYYLTVCRYLRCDVPDYNQTSELRTRELVIRSHPRREDALIVDVLLRNGAGFRQTFPPLQLSFYDIRGDVVASRVFRVSEYLGGEMRGLKYIPARTEVRLSLEIVDPGEDALGYEMIVFR